MSTKIYVTKYALTDGVWLAELIEKDDRYFIVKLPGGFMNRLMVKRSNEGFETFADARKNVLKRIEARLRSIAKSERAMQSLYSEAVADRMKVITKS